MWLVTLYYKPCLCTYILHLLKVGIVIFALSHFVTYFCTLLMLSTKFLANSKNNFEYIPLVNQELMKFIDDRELGKEREIPVMSIRSVQKYVTKCEVRSILTPIFQVIGVYMIPPSK
ncbi:hypothetical protein Bandiella_01174 [Candidatus Bandiella woodruffii]|uniref:Uncharacterized protein n=1 Tax=Candidatus Bandiella euplotis TaxID=1664265 RepID=A0ABZ0UQN7_9RICK|nr:hypothetical protein Bandiella_01174 [Candidatus Bandiella woodruffii]